MSDFLVVAEVGQAHICSNCGLKIPTYSHGQELFYKSVIKITNKLVKQLLSMTVCVRSAITYLVNTKIFCFD